MSRKLAIVCTHPIQYTAPVFRTLAASDRLDVRVFYTWSQAADARIYDADFGREIRWDVPLLDGYSYQFVENTSKNPGLAHFNGLSNPTLIPLIEAWRPDAVLVYTWNSKSHLQAMRHFKGRVPVLFRGDSTLLDHRQWWHALLRRGVLTWVYRHIDIALAVGTRNRSYFAWCGLPQGRIAFAPHSVDTTRFAANHERHAKLAGDWRQQLRIPDDAVVILFAGKLQWQKDPELLLDAFGAVSDRAHLVFVGNGEYEQALRTRASTMAGVHFMPFQNQSVMPAIYRLGDVFVLPSRTETWGLALNEAMACGRAIVASSRVGGACDLIRSDENGWIFESGSAAELRRILERAVSRGQSGLRRMGMTGQTLSAHWSNERAAHGIEQTVLAACCSGSH